MKARIFSGARSAQARTTDDPSIDGARSHTADRIDEATLLSVLSDVRGGDFSARMPVEWTGVAGKIADRLNDVIAANQTLEAELARVSRVVGQEGKLSQRAIRGSDQVWSESIDSVNSLIEDLVRPTSEMQRVIGAVADGDLSKKITAEVHGEMFELKNTINAMVDQLNRFVSEVTRVAREVGTEGKLGQAAAVTIEVGGVWKDLTDNVNLMATNLTGQVRDIAEVTTAVANGDLSKKITADVKGEFLELKDTVNAMVDRFKAINDAHGHDVGDEVLRFIAEVVRSTLRDGDLVGRWGGEEFLALLPFTDRDGAEVVAERVRAAVALAPVVVGDRLIPVSVSVGVAARRDEQSDALVANADAAMYAAKTAGRNGVRVAAS